jgi:hypothetical protein
MRVEILVFPLCIVLIISILYMGGYWIPRPRFIGSESAQPVIGFIFFIFFQATGIFI